LRCNQRAIWSELRLLLVDELAILPTHMKSVVNASSLAGQRVAGTAAPRQKTAQIQQPSPPDRRPEFPSQDANPLAMKHDTTLPSTPAGDLPRLLARLPVVLKVTGLGRSAIYRWIADGSFPPPVRLGPRAVARRWSDLDRWTQSRDTAQH
jgi:prophage regulatory protein